MGLICKHMYELFERWICCFLYLCDDNVERPVEFQEKLDILSKYQRDYRYNDLQRRFNKFNIPAWNAYTICFSMIWLVFHFRYGAIRRTIQQCQSRSMDLVLFRCLKLALFIQVTICTRWPMTSHIQVITSSASNVEMTLYLTVHFLRELHFKCYARTWSNIMLYYIYKFYYLFETKYSIFCILWS